MLQSLRENKNVQPDQLSYTLAIQVIQNRNGVDPSNRIPSTDVDCCFSCATTPVARAHARAPTPHICRTSKSDGLFAPRRAAPRAPSPSKRVRADVRSKTV